MVVGALRMQLRIAGNASLKAKRSVVRSVLSKTQHRFNVSAAEVADNDVHTLASLGFVVVSSDRKHADSMLSNIGDYVTEVAEAPVVHRSTELIEMDTVHSSEAEEAGLRWSDFEEDS